MLYSVLHNELWQKPLPFTSLNHEQFVKLQQASAKQTIEGLVMGALIRNNVKLERADALLAYSRTMMIEQLNHKVNAVAKELATILANDGIDYRIFKGQTLALLYPHPETRMPGDIDFYCVPNHFARAQQLLQKAWGITLGGEESMQHRDFSYKDVPLEMHFCMMKFNSHAIQTYWERLLAEASIEQVSIEGVAVNTLPPTLNVLYTFLHLYHHLVELGVGLRQFCDLLVLLHRHCETIDRVALEKHLRAMGFYRAFCAIGAVLINKLNLPANEFPFTISASDAQYQDAILDIVFIGGNFGKHHSNTAVRSGMRYNIEATMRKLRHYRLFWRLSPREIRATLVKELPRKMVMLGFKKANR